MGIVYFVWHHPMQYLDVIVHSTHLPKLWFDRGVVLGLLSILKSSNEFPCANLKYIYIYLVLCSIALAAASHLEEAMKKYSVCILVWARMEEQNSRPIRQLGKAASTPSATIWNKSLVARIPKVSRQKMPYLKLNFCIGLKSIIQYKVIKLISDSW